MSYIKVDKETPADPRLAESATSMEDTLRAILTGSDELARYAVTLTATFGTLVTLWCYADRYVLNNNTLPVTLDGLAAIMRVPVEILRRLPECWLKVRTDGRVELPGYVAKNRIVGKDLRKTTPAVRDGNRRRQARYRDKRRTTNGHGAEPPDVTGVCVTPPSVTTGTGTGTVRPIPEPATVPLASALGRLAGRPESPHNANTNGNGHGGTSRKPKLSREPKTPDALRADARWLSSRGMATPDVARVLAQHGVTETDVSAWIAEPEGSPS